MEFIRTYSKNEKKVAIGRRARMKKVDKTIESICVWIEKKLDYGKPDNNHEVSEMVKALAELVSARGTIP